MQRENREFNASGDMEYIRYSGEPRGPPFAKLAAGRHSILKERLTAGRPALVCAWLASRNSGEIMRKSVGPWHIRWVIRTQSLIRNRHPLFGTMPEPLI